MIPVIGGWRAVRDVDRLTLVSVEGAERGHIVYRERVRPVLRLERLVARELGPLVSRARCEAMVTQEGEHAVLASVVEGDGRARHDVGLVFVDDFYACIHGTCRAPAEYERFHALVRALVLRDSHGLVARRRRYLYTPPAGWQGLARGLETHWFPLDYPRNRSTISVAPAIPEIVDRASFVDSRLRVDEAAGFVASEVRAPEPVEADSGLDAVIYGVVGTAGAAAPFEREVAVLQDARHTYPLLFDSAGSAKERGEARRRFREVVRSVRCLPARRGAIPEDVTSLWSD